MHLSSTAQNYSSSSQCNQDYSLPPFLSSFEVYKVCFALVLFDSLVIFVSVNCPHLLSILRQSTLMYLSSSTQDSSLSSQRIQDSCFPPSVSSFFSLLQHHPTCLFATTFVYQVCMATCRQNTKKCIVIWSQAFLLHFIVQRTVVPTYLDIIIITVHETMLGL